MTYLDDDHQEQGDDITNDDIAVALHALFPVSDSDSEIDPNELYAVPLDEQLDRDELESIALTVEEFYE